MQGNRRVVVTGLGVVTALGLEEASFWESMLAGKCGLAPVRGFDTTGYRTTVSSQVDDAALETGIWVPTNTTPTRGSVAYKTSINRAMTLQSDASSGSSTMGP